MMAPRSTVTNRKLESPFEDTARKGALTRYCCIVNGFLFRNLIFRNLKCSCNESCPTIGCLPEDRSRAEGRPPEDGHAATPGFNSGSREMDRRLLQAWLPRPEGNTV